MNHAIQATTILCVRRKGKVAIGSDGQVTLGDTVIKQGAKKIRRLYNEKILAGFAGSSADSFALFARFEAKLEQFHGNLSRAAVELAKDWRTDRSLRRREARRCHRPPEPDPTPKASTGDGRRGDAEEHHHDGTDRRRENRNRAAPCETRQFALPES